MSKFSGLYSGLVDKYTLTIPVLVDERGEELTGDDAKKRRKRSSDLNYKLKIENEDVILELFPSSEFISPNLIVERRSRFNRTRRIIRNYIDNATGRVTSLVMVIDANYIRHFLSRSLQY